MKKVKITVYISSFNYGKYIQEAINSVLKQLIKEVVIYHYLQILTYSVSHEVIEIEGWANV